MLTSSQHFEKAHPNGNTQIVDAGYQFCCLMHKVRSIRENLENEVGIPKIYDLSKLKKVLKTGLQTEYFELIDFNDYEAIGEGIYIHYPPDITSYYNLSLEKRI